MILNMKHFSSSCKAIIAITAMFVTIVCVWALIEEWQIKHINSTKHNIANTDLPSNR